MRYLLARVLCFMLIITIPWLIVIGLGLLLWEVVT